MLVLHTRVPTILVGYILHCELIRWCSSLSDNFFAKFYTPYVLVVWYVRLVLIILRVNVIVVC